MGKHCEPSLDEIFGERAVRELMASDGVSEAALRRLLGTLRRNLQERPDRPLRAAAECRPCLRQARAVISQ